MNHNKIAEPPHCDLRLFYINTRDHSFSTYANGIHKGASGMEWGKNLFRDRRVQCE